jgi:predicted metal-binding membrane protein
MLMLLLFVLGVMNVAWIAALTVFVLLEKTWPATWRGARLISLGGAAALLLWGAMLLFASGLQVG